MNKICGYLLHKETRLGIPWLVIEVYDADPGTQPEERLASTGDDVGTAPSLSSGNFRTNFTGDRLGSVLTNDKGYFELEYDDEAFRRRNRDEDRPDLTIIVTAPEEAGIHPNKSILYVSHGIRQGAGKNENYIILLTTEQLTEAGVPLPKASEYEPDAPTAAVAQFKNFATTQSQIYSGVRGVLVAQVNSQRQLTQRAETKLQDLYETLSTVPESIRESNRYLRPGEHIETKAIDVWRDGISKKVNPSEMTGYISLTEDQIQALNLRDSEGNLRSGFEVPAVEIESLIFKQSNSESHSRVLYRENPVDFICREQHLPNPCQHLFEEEVSTPENETDDSSTDNNGDITVTDSGDLISSTVTQIMQGIASPNTLIPNRPTQEDIQASIGAFKLHRSPADSTAVRNFYNFQIAFEHVWQEVFDEDVLDTAKDIYEQIVEQGGNPEAASGDSKLSIAVLKAESRNILNAQRNLKQSPILPSMLRSSRYGRKPRVPDFEEPRVPDFRDNIASPNDDVNSERMSAPKIPNLINELEERLKEPYSFKVFSPNSVNFGVLVTYRQEWEPLNYQVGKLVSTIPLAPGEERTYTKKMVHKKSRAQKETEKNLSSEKRETADTYRAETDIAQRAEKKTNFSLSAEGEFDIFLSSGSQTSSFTTETGNASEDKKRSFQEAVVKASHEYTSEFYMEVETEESFEFESTETGKIVNPNNEITLTCLFYELQRRFRVSSKIHRVMPVVLVAQQVPKPNEIDTDWLLAHDWILKRVLLDDSFLPALTYLSTGIMGDEFTLKEMRKTLEQQRQLVNKLQQNFVAVQEQVSRRYSAIQRAIEQEAGIVGGNEGLLDDTARLGLAVVTGGISEGISEVAGFLGLGGPDDEDKREAAKIRQEAAKDAYEKALREERDLQAQIEREVTALEAATRNYTKAYSEHLNRKLQISRLKLHVKNNILYYMQAIWKHEPPDQQFFRLFNVKCPVLKGDRTYTLSPTEPGEVMPNLPHMSLTQFKYSVRCQLPTDLDDPDQFKPLVEVADLDTPLGYKGNYAIFPLRESNDLTDYMLAPYLDAQLGLRDPDDFGNWTLDDFTKYVCCLKETLSDEEFESLKEQLQAQYKHLLTAPHQSVEEIIVPTDSLFIEALPGAHPLLEDFKLLHRAIDVAKVAEEVRYSKLENARLAARILDNQLDDADIEKKIVIEGNPTHISISEDDNA